jgi:hypothetical protein
MMNTTEEMLEFSRTNAAGSDSDNDIRRAPWFASHDSSPVHGIALTGSLSHADARFATWGGWSSRGIPELCSPLAD